MRLTTKGRFAVTAMLDLALHGADGPVTLAGISERQKISLSYLEQLFGKLRRRALVESVRGPGGGYHLARDASQVSVADIVRAVEEPLDSTQCGGRENCHGNERCIVPGQIEAEWAKKCASAGGLLFSKAEVDAFNEISAETGQTTWDDSALKTVEA